jgi:tRNA U55 pseudouridine synthase TruB
MPVAGQRDAQALEIIGVEGADVTLRVDCSAGFYVRSLAHDLGTSLGTARICRRSGGRGLGLTLDDAMPLDLRGTSREDALDALLPMESMLLSSRLSS